MTRAFVLVALAAAASASVVATLSPPQARAVAAEKVIGAYRIKIAKGDGWWRGASSPYRVGRFAGAGILVFTKTDPDDGKVHAAIQLDAKLDGSLLDLATPNPAAFVGAGYVIGDSMTLLDAGSGVGAGRADYVNVLNIQFIKDGAKLSGHWTTSYPPTDPSSGPASGINADFTGKRLPHFKARNEGAKPR